MFDVNKYNSNPYFSSLICLCYKKTSWRCVDAWSAPKPSPLTRLCMATCDSTIVGHTGASIPPTTPRKRQSGSDEVLDLMLQLQQWEQFRHQQVIGDVHARSFQWSVQTISQLLSRVEAFYKEWDTEKYYEGDKSQYEVRYIRTLHFELYDPRFSKFCKRLISKALEEEE